MYVLYSFGRTDFVYHHSVLWLCIHHLIHTNTMSRPPTYTHIERLPEELLRFVLLEIDSLPSLYKLIQAIPLVAHSCIAIFDELVGSILERSIDEELQCYLFAVVESQDEAQAAGGMGRHEIQDFLQTHFEYANTVTIPAGIPRSLHTIAYMANVLEAVDHFSKLLPEIWSFCGCIGLFRRPILPLTMWKDKYRLRRALFRFQLYCELFHKPGDDNPHHIASKWGWEDNWDAQELFWLRYEWWEVEEVKSIYYTLHFHLDCQSKSTSPILPPDCEREPTTPPLSIRGLPTLHATLTAKCPLFSTPFQKAYLQIFLQRPFSGFRITDPEDHGHFSQGRIPNLFHDPIPFPTYRTGPMRRWEPSPFPGVTLKQLCIATYGCNTVPIEVERLNTTAKRRQVLRYLGWCFWERKDLAEWAFFGAGLGDFRRKRGNDSWFYDSEVEDGP